MYIETQLKNTFTIDIESDMLTQRSVLQPIVWDNKKIKLFTKRLQMMKKS